MRARDPDAAGFVDRDGVRLGYGVFGEGAVTVLLLPTWTIVHARVWKMQVPYLSRYYRVVTYDGPGNGRSDLITDPARYTTDSCAADAVAVLDHIGADRAVVVGLSKGAHDALRLASLHPDRVAGLGLIAAALPLGLPNPAREGIVENFYRPYPPEPKGWEKYNLAYWHDHFSDFVEFFFAQAFNEAHSTKPRDDCLEWAMEGGPEYLEADAAAPPPDYAIADLLRSIDCPTLFIHGTEDRIRLYAEAEEAARLSGGTLVALEGSGHLPNVRDPVKCNLLLRRFIEEVAA